MGFKSGAEWNGNAKGAPKKQFRRDDFTDEIFADRKERVKGVADRVLAHAENDEPWACKLVFEYFLTRPKNRDVPEENNKGEVAQALSQGSIELLIEFQKRILDEIKTKGEQE